MMPNGALMSMGAPFFPFPLLLEPTTTGSFNANAWAPGASPSFGADTDGWIEAR